MYIYVYAHILLTGSSDSLSSSVFIFFFNHWFINGFLYHPLSVMCASQKFYFFLLSAFESESDLWCNSFNPNWFEMLPVLYIVSCIYSDQFMNV